MSYTETESPETVLSANGLILTEKEIQIDGLTREYNFLFLSDTHCIIKTTDTIDVWNVTTDERILSFSNEMGLASADQFSLWIEFANESNLDGVLLGGDIIDYLSEANVDYIYEELQKLQVPYLYTMGNHDSYDVLDGNVFSDDDESLARLFQDGDYECQVMDMEEFYIVSVNDYGSGARAKVSEKALTEFQKIYYEAEKPIILMVHVPLTTEATQQLKTDTENVWGMDLLLGTNLDYEIDETTETFYDMVLADDSPVVAVLTGHIHFYHEDWLNENIIQIVSDTSSNGNGILLEIHN